MAKNLGKDIDAVEIATAEWVRWFNTSRPHSAVGMRTLAEQEAAWVPDVNQNCQEQSQPTAAGTRHASLHKTRGDSPFLDFPPMLRRVISPPLRGRYPLHQRIETASYQPR